MSISDEVFLDIDRLSEQVLNGTLAAEEVVS